ncbi:hypothetical protein [Ornithinimicrobium kibberense]|uniref:hypothetical protein n=1 Tax=Ornithinimicrobium kibberense TaxID=282060 RepID=UPI00362463E1
MGPEQGGRDLQDRSCQPVAARLHHRGQGRTRTRRSCPDVLSHAPAERPGPSAGAAQPA